MSQMSAVVVNEESLESSSSDESQSLLCSFNAHQSREAPQGTEVMDLNSSGNKEEKKELQEHQDKPPESVTSTITLRTSECPNAASQSAAFKLPKNIKKRSITGETLLHKACMRGDVARARLLIQAGICVNAEDNAGWTALHEASAVGDVALVEELLKAGANVHARSSGGVTPLQDAVVAGHCEVVKLLLQYGSGITNRTLGGVAAAEMEKEPSIKELLQGSAFTQQHHCGASSETSRQTSVGWNSTVDRVSREGSVREPGDIQPCNKGPDAGHSPSDNLTVLLEEVKRKQAEMSTWPLAGLQDADRYFADLTQIQNELTEVLDKQHVLRDNLLQRPRTAPECLLRRLLKNDAALLAARQQTLVEMLHKHVDLVKAFVATEVKVSTQTFRRTRSSSTVGRQQPGRSSTPPSASFSASKAHARNPNSQKKMAQKLDDVFRPAPELFQEQKLPAAAAASVSSRKKSLKRTDVLTEQAKHHQDNRLKSGNPSTRISFRMKAGNALIQGSAEDRSRRLSELIERGLVSPGDVLRLQFKGRRHSAHVHANGGIKDSKGKVHAALELWLESIAGNNIPVSSAYAWSKVTFRDQPLSSYLSTPEAAGQPPQPRSEDHVGVELCQEAPPMEPALTEAHHAHSLIRNIQIIHLVSDEDLVPSALLDRHWEKLLEQDWDRW